MKTTIDIADGLLEQAKRIARREGRTLRDVIEEALRKQLREPRPGTPFRLRSHSFKGRGLQPGLQEGDWEKVRGMIYPRG